MNIVDLLKDQLTGDALSKVAGMAGASEADVKKVAGAGLPGLLGGLASMASKKEGAGKLADAIGGLDPKVLGNLGGMLSGGSLQKGGDMLGSLMGAGTVDSMSAAISKFTGVNASIVKTILGFLAPIVLSYVGSSFKGGKIDAAGITKLFDDQKSNIMSSLPKGMSLDSIPGLSSLAGAGSAAQAAASQVQSAASGGLGMFLPAILVVVAAGIFYYIYTQSTKAKEAEKSATQVIDESRKVVDQVNSKLEEIKSSQAGLVEKMKDAVGNIPAIDSVKDDLTSALSGLTEKLSGIKDSAGAEAALPDLTDFAGKLDGFTKTMNLVPAEGKTMLVDLIKGQMDKINPLLEQINAIPGLGDAVKKIVEQIKEKLTSLAA